MGVVFDNYSQQRPQIIYVHINDTKGEQYQAHILNALIIQKAHCLGLPCMRDQCCPPRTAVSRSGAVGMLRIELEEGLVRLVTHLLLVKYTCSGHY